MYMNVQSVTGSHAYSHVDECLVEEQYPFVADRYLHTTVLGIAIELKKKKNQQKDGYSN